MTRLATLLAALVLLALAGCGDDEPETTTTTPTTETTTETETTTAEPTVGERGCGDVAFEPQTDAGAFDISAEGVDCETARRVAAAAEDQATEDYSAEGFDCSGTAVGGELPSTEYTCRRGEDRIIFSVS